MRRLNLMINDCVLHLRCEAKQRWAVARRQVYNLPFGYRIALLWCYPLKMGKMLLPCSCARMCSFRVIKQTGNPKRSLRDKDLGNFHQLFFFMASRNVVCHAVRCKACGIPLVSFCTEICPCVCETRLWFLVPLGCLSAHTVWAASLFMAKTCHWVSSGTNLRVLVFLPSGLNFLLLLTRIALKELRVVCSSRTEWPRQLLCALSWLQVGSLLTALCGLVLRYSLLPCSCLPKKAAFPGNNEAVRKIITMPRSEAGPGPSILLPCRKVKTSVS